MARAVLITLLACLCGCASEGERYRYSVAHVHICPNARSLSKDQIDEIWRIVTHATPQTAMAIGSYGPAHQHIWVTTTYPGTLKQTAPQRESFGFVALDRDHSTWKVSKVAKDLDPVLAFSFACTR